MKHKIAVALLTAVLGVGLAGCASESRPAVAPVPDELPNRPALNSVPDDAVYVAVMAGPGGFEYDLVKGQRYYLANIEDDELLTSGVAKEDASLKVGENGATLGGDSIWKGDIDSDDQIGLFVMKQLEQL